jgi:hypothetical protein
MDESTVVSRLALAVILLSVSVILVSVAYALDKFFLTRRK